MKFQPVAFPPVEWSVVEPVMTEEQKVILKPLYDAESAANSQGLDDLQEQLSGLIWHLSEEWGLIEK